jgi:hypothetical protein
VEYPPDQKFFKTPHRTKDIKASPLSVPVLQRNVIEMASITDTSNTNGRNVKIFGRIDIFSVYYNQIIWSELYLVLGSAILSKALNSND